ncbi:MAG: type II secretion system protein [Stenotrophomonas sp.]
MIPRHPRRQGQRGFSLLEAIVALTIMATSLLALYAWLSTSTFALGRARASALALQDARTAQAVVETINPMAEPSGRRELATLEITWKARPVTDRRIGMSRAGSPTQFDFGLYDMEIEVKRNGEIVRNFRMRKAGWEAARPILPIED